MLSQEALDVLSRSVCDPSKLTVKLPKGELERPLYSEIDECLSRIGGKWTKKLNAHLFPYDPEPLLQAVLESGELPPKNPHAFFPTPASVVADMLDVAGLSEFCSDWRILEPSAGTGAIAKAVRALTGTQVDCCEYMDVNRRVLRAEGFDVVANDFLEYEPGFLYDAVLLNPPFSVEEDKTAYITHCLKAWSLLKEHGKFVAIVPCGWTYAQAKKITAFREWVCDFLDWFEIPAGTFKESGTMIPTICIYGEKESECFRLKPWNGWSTYHAWNACLHFDSDYEVYKSLSACKDREKFEDACQHAAKQLVSKEGVPIVLRGSELADLWKHYQED